MAKAISPFVTASRNRDLDLHMSAREVLAKLFFAMEVLQYKFLFPCYRADTNNLKKITGHMAAAYQCGVGGVGGVGD